MDRHTGADETARPARSVGPKLRQRHRLEPAVATHPVERRAQVRRCVGKRAVEIEEDGAERAGRRHRPRLSHDPAGEK